MKLKLFTLLALIISFCAPLYAQLQPLRELEKTVANKPCDQAAPEIRGLKLGMPYAGLDRLFNSPMVSTKAGDALLDVRLTSDNWKSQTEKFKDVASIHLSFYKNSLWEVIVNYNDSTQWQSIDEFTARLSKVLSLPPAWQKTSGDLPNSRALMCTNFRLVASLNSPTSNIVLTDTEMIKTMKQDRAQKKKNLKQL